MLGVSHRIVRYCTFGAVEGGCIPFDSRVKSPPFPLALPLSPPGGINIYLEKFSYSNAISDDLWASLGEFSGVDVASLMEPWTLQVDYHVIHIAEDGTFQLGDLNSKGKQNLILNPIYYPSELLL